MAASRFSRSCRLLLIGDGGALAANAALAEVRDGVVDRPDVLSVFVGDLQGLFVAAELFLDGHYQFDDIQRVGVKVFGE